MHEFIRRIIESARNGDPILSAPTVEVDSVSWTDLAHGITDALAAGSNARIEAIEYGFSPEYAEHVAESVANMAMVAAGSVWQMRSLEAAR